MAHKRFIRDGVIDGLIAVVEETLHSTPEEDSSFQYQFINSILITFKTSKVALQRIEESIEYARLNDPTGEICLPLSEASVHIQTGIQSLFESLQANAAPSSEEISLTDLV